MGADHPVSWCKDYQGGRSFYTGLGNTAAASRRRPADAPQGRDRLGRRPGRPGLQRLRRDRARELPADQDQRHRRTSASRSASTSSRTAASSRPPAAATCACTTRRRARRRRSPTSPTELPRRADLHQLRGRPLRPGGRQRTSPPTSGSTSTTRRRPSTNVKLLRRHDRSRTTDARPTAPRRTSAPTPTRVGSVRRLLPALALQVRRRRPSGPAHWTSTSEQQILRVSNNRGRAATSRATSTSTSTTTCGSSRVTTRRPAAATPAASARSTTRRPTRQQTVRVTNATGGTFTLTFNGQTTAPIAVQRDRARRSTPRSRRSRNIGADNIQVTRRPGRTRRTSDRVLRRRASSSRTSPQLTANARRPDRHRARPSAVADDAGGRLVPARRPATPAARR